MYVFYIFIIINMIMTLLLMIGNSYIINVLLIYNSLFTKVELYMKIYI